MEIREIEINKIKEDPNQPRKNFNPVRIKEMAKSILTTGIINPIEVDSNSVIITGAMRFRASKEAGLETMPCKVMEISENDRFMRQVIENLQHNTMTDWDTAKSLEKLLSLLPPGGSKTGSGGRNDKGITSLADRLGVSDTYIGDHLDILKSPDKIQTAIKENKLSYTMLRAVKHTPEEHKEDMEKKIANGEFKTRDGAIAVAQAIRQNPTKAKEILNQDYSDCDTTDKVKNKIKGVDPNFSSHPMAEGFARSCELPDEIGDLIVRLIKILRENPPKSIGTFHLGRVVGSLTTGKNSIEKWLSVDEIEIPKIIQIQ